MYFPTLPEEPDDEGGQPENTPSASM